MNSLFLCPQVLANRGFPQQMRSRYPPAPSSSRRGGERWANPSTRWLFAFTVTTVSCSRFVSEIQASHLPASDPPTPAPQQSTLTGKDQLVTKRLLAKVPRGSGTVSTTLAQCHWALGEVFLGEILGYQAQAGDGPGSVPGITTHAGHHRNEAPPREASQAPGTRLGALHTPFSSNLPAGPRGGRSPSLLGEGTEFGRLRYPSPRNLEVAAYAPTRCRILEIKLFTAVWPVRLMTRRGGQAGVEAERRPRDPRPSPATG